MFQLLFVLVLLSIIVMCGAVTYRMWQAGRVMGEFRACLPLLMGAVGASRAVPPPLTEEGPTEG